MGSYLVQDPNFGDAGQEGAMDLGARVANDRARLGIAYASHLRDIPVASAAQGSHQLGELSLSAQ